MGKIVAGLFMSLDGVIESPDQWHFPYWSDEMGEVVGGQLATSDAMLLGRITYEGFAAYWPQQSEDENEMAGFMNNTQKYVVSNTLKSADWQNSTIISGDVYGELRRLTQEEGKTLGITGSTVLIRSLLRENLLDELHLLVHPIVVGGGMQRLFPEGETQLPLKLANSQQLPNGVVHLVYGSADS